MNDLAVGSIFTDLLVELLWKQQLCRDAAGSEAQDV